MLLVRLTSVCIVTFILKYTSGLSENSNPGTTIAEAFSVKSLTEGNITLGVNRGPEESTQYFQQSSPERISLFMQDTHTVSLNYSIRCETAQDAFNVNVSSLDEDTFVITGNPFFVINCSAGLLDPIEYSVDLENISGISDNEEFTQGTIEFEIEGQLLGVATLFIEARKNTGSDVVIDAKLLVFVLRKLRIVDLAFRYIVGVFLFFVFIGFGCKLDLDVVKECIKRPIAPAIGLGCQYLIMPLLGYGIAVLTPIEDKSVRLGIFLCGVCPGGGLSNIYTYLLGGDVSLSITMTFISTLASIVFLPLWIYTLGRTLMDDSISLTIPFVPLLQTIILTTVPVLIGILIKYKFLKAAKLVVKVLKPVLFISVGLFIVIGVISNWSLFKLFKPMYIVSGSLLPYLGYFIGGIIPAILRQPWTRVKTIAIEAGMQNVGVAFILLLISFPPPFGDIASLAPAANALMTPIPGLLVAIPYLIYRKYTKKYDAVQTEEERDNENSKSKDTNISLLEKLSSV